jgi:hypothetical protein
LQRTKEKVSVSISLIFLYETKACPFRESFILFFNYLCSNFIASFGVKVETVDRVTSLTAILHPTAFDSVFMRKHF